MLKHALTTSITICSYVFQHSCKSQQSKSHWLILSKIFITSLQEDRAPLNLSTLGVYKEHHHLALIFCTVTFPLDCLELRVSYHKTKALVKKVNMLLQLAVFLPLMAKRKKKDQMNKYYNYPLLSS